MQCQHINDERGRGVGIPTSIRLAIRRCQRSCILLLARSTCRGCRNAQSWHLHLQPRRRTSSDLQRHAPPRHRPLAFRSSFLVQSWFASCCRKLGRQGNHVLCCAVLCCAVCPVRALQSSPAVPVGSPVGGQLIHSPINRRVARLGMEVAAAWMDSAWQRQKGGSPACPACPWKKASVEKPVGHQSFSYSATYSVIPSYSHTVIQSYNHTTGQPLSETLMPAEGRIESWDN
jgi:hypothetical protein